MTKTPKKAIELHDVTISYQGQPVLWDIDFALPQGELIAIVGRNGAGKTTLLKCMMGLIPQESGHILFFGQPLQKMKKKIAYMPQRQAIDWEFPILVKDVVMMGRYPHMGFFKRERPIDKEKVHEALQMVNMLPFMERELGALSVGQQKRVFMARLLAQEADICLLDEPFAGVDATTTTTLLQILRKLTQQGKTVIMVHHTLEAIEKYATYVILLNTYLVAAGPTQQVLTPTHIEKAYQDQEGILDHVRGLLSQKEVPAREN